MRQDELTGLLRRPYDAGAGFGLAKAGAPGYENVWFVVPPPPPRVPPRRVPLGALAKANAVLARLPSFKEMSPIDKLINYYFVRREAVESSRLEGTWSTIDSVLTPVEALGDEPSKSENRSVRGYAHALERQSHKALKDKERVFTETLVRAIHADIVSRDPHFNGTPGALRKPGTRGEVVWIGGGGRVENSTYNPTPARHVKAALRGVLNWLADEDLAQRGDAGLAGFTLPVRLAVGHSHFEAVHPFSDGNGRVGRALWPLQMVCSDRMPLYLSGYVEDQKDAYGQALQRAQKKLDYVPIVEFICEAIVRSEVGSRATRAAIEGLPSRWKSRARFRAGSSAQRALELLVRNPIVTTTLVMEELKVSRQAATVAVNQLVERRIVRPRGKAGRTQLFAAEELIALLSRRFGADPRAALAAGLATLAKR